ncbi:MAG: glycosyltransferase family 4 protein [bacterium]|nr:glycosyltransferase family 4 protein [bacterium]
MVGDERYTVALVASFPPPGAGMTRQARFLADALRRDGAAVIEIDTVSGLPLRRRFARLARMSRRLSAIRGADLVLIFAGSYASFYAFSAWPLLAAKAMGKPVVLLYKGGQAGDFFAGSGSLAKAFIRMADAIAVPGPYLQTIFAEAGFDAQIVPDLLDPSGLRESAPLIVSPIVAMTRRHHPVYGVDVAIRVAARVAAEMPEVMFEVANAGEDYEEMQRLAADIAPDNVRFLGELSRDGIADLLERATLMLNTSRFDNHPNSLIEAAIVGLPFVTTAAGGIPLLFEDGRDCLTAPVDDIEGLTRITLRLLRDTELGAKLAASARERCRELYWDIAKPGILDEYRNLISC